jgi:hypothetical protein
MTRQWYLYRSTEHNYINDYFVFNQIPHNEIDLWCPAGKCHDIPDLIRDASYTGIVIEYGVLFDLVSNTDTFDRLIKYLSNGNMIWVWTIVDTYFMVNIHRSLIERLDAMVPHGSVWLFIDSLRTPGHWSHGMKNLQFPQEPFNGTVRFCRLIGSVTTKTDNPRDFMLTMSRHRKRPHRRYLWNELLSRPGLKDRGHVRYNPYRLALDPAVNCNLAPDMRLVRDSWCEIAPETLYKGAYFVTEKTLKPINSNQPFMILSTMGFLQHLRDRGFRTFNGIIDESYDLEFRAQDRARKIIDQLEDIVRNGSREFYQACMPILDHNRRRLAEIAGSWQYETDLFLHQCLENAN